jgi:hypothetical protein
MQTARHESLHAVALFVLLGSEYVPRVSRKADAHSLGRTQLLDLPDRNPAINAAVVATASLVPLFDDSIDLAGCEADVRFVREKCAEVAYRHRPPHERGISVDDWVELWTHGTVADRAKELLKDSRFRRLVLALERALDYRQELEPHEVRAVLEEADADT